MPQMNQPGQLGPDDQPVQKALAPETDTNIPLDQRAKDPVCGSTVDMRTARFTANYVEGGATRTFYFESDECKQAFERDPEQYSNLI